MLKSKINFRRFAMTRTKLKDRQLPSYSKSEEIINSVSHSVGGVFGIFALVSCVIISIKHHDNIALISSIVFGLSMVFLFTMSSVYHGLPVSITKKVFQVIDHCAVYILTAGSYTPILLCAVRKYAPVRSYIMFAIVWGLSTVCIVFNSIDLKKYRVFSMICNIGIGWFIIIEIHQLYIHLGSAPVALLLAGGLSYTIGVILYGIGQTKKYFHSVFHFFVLGGAILHYLMIAMYIL